MAMARCDMGGVLRCVSIGYLWRIVTRTGLPSTGQAATRSARPAAGSRAARARSRPRPRRSRPPRAPRPTRRAAQREPPRPGALAAGKTATSAATRPTPSPSASRSECSPSSSRRRARGAEPDRAQQRQFAAALQDVAQHHHPQPQAAEQQPQAAEDGEDREVGVLHRRELRQPLRPRGPVRCRRPPALLPASAPRLRARAAGASTRKTW